jgi:carnosine N-methyltransferase
MTSTETARQHIIYPFIHSFSNLISKQDVLTPISVPDVLPSNLPSNVDFSMTAGEFIEVYSNEEHKGKCKDDKVISSILRG